MARPNWGDPESQEDRMSFCKEPWKRYYLYVIDFFNCSDDVERFEAELFYAYRKGSTEFFKTDGIDRYNFLQFHNMMGKTIKKSVIDHFSSIIGKSFEEIEKNEFDNIEI